jgi:hypothetical protein
MVAYYRVFSLPIRLLGMDIFETMIKFKPLINDNVIIGMSERTNDIFLNIKGEYKQPIGVFIRDAIDGIMATSLKRESDGVVIDISKETHDLIDTLYELDKDRGKVAVEKALVIIMPVISLRTIALHLNKCYAVIMVGEPSLAQIADMIRNTRDIYNQEGTVCRCQTDVASITKNLMMRKERFNRQVCRSVYDDSLIISGNDVIQTRKVTYDKQQRIIDTMPIEGFYYLIKVKKEKSHYKDFRRCIVYDQYINNKKQLMVTQKTLTIKSDMSNIGSMIQSIESYWRTGNNVILLNDDTIPSLIKRECQDLLIKNIGYKKLIVPDHLMYATMLMKLKFIEAAMGEPDETKGKKGTNAERNSKESDNEKEWTNKEIIYMVLGLGLVLLLIVLLYYFWPSLMSFLLFPGRFISRKMTTVVVTKLPKTLLQTMLGKPQSLAMIAKVPAWSKLLAYVANGVWWTFLSGGVYKVYQELVKRTS